MWLLGARTRDVKSKSQAAVTKVHFRSCNGKMLLRRLLTTCLGWRGKEWRGKKENNNSDFIYNDLK